MPPTPDVDLELSNQSMDDVKLVAPSGRKSRLREALVGIDALAFFVAWTIALFVPGRTHRSPGESLLLALATTVLGLWLLSVQELYLARVSAIRSVELSRLTRAAFLAALGEVLMTRILHVPAAVDGGRGCHRPEHRVPHHRPQRLSRLPQPSPPQRPLLPLRPDRGGKRRSSRHRRAHRHAPRGRLPGGRGGRRAQRRDGQRAGRPLGRTARSMLRPPGGGRDRRGDRGRRRASPRSN